MKSKEHKKEIYKLWWFWIIIALSTMLIFQTFFNHRQTTQFADKGNITNTKVNNASSHVTTKSKKGVAPTKSPSIDTNNLIKFEDKNLNILDKKKYNLDFSDNSWPGATTKIESVEVIKTDPFVFNDSTNAKAQGIIIAHLSLLPSKDIYAYTGTATLITNNGQQIETEYYSVKNYQENPDGSIANGVTKSGDLIFPIEKLDQVKDINSLRLKFSVEDDNDSDDNYDYDFTINL